MKTDNRIIGLIAVVVVVAALGVYLYINHKHKQEAKAQEELVIALDFATDAVNTITAAWNPEELQKRAHPVLMDSISKSGTSLDEYFKMLKKLGKLDKGTCNISNFVTPKDATFRVADYLCDAQFENAPAKLLVEIRQDNPPSGPWLINSFRIDSPIFAAKKDADKK